MGIFTADACGNPPNEVIAETDQIKKRAHHIIAAFARFDEATVLEKNERPEIGPMQLRVQA